MSANDTARRIVTDRLDGAASVLSTLTWLAAASAVVLVGCGTAGAGRIAAGAADPLARWRPFTHINGPVDVVASSSIVFAAAGRLGTLSPAGVPARFDRSYRSPGGGEPYIALSPGGCFGRRTIYALRLVKGPGVVAVRTGRVRRLATINAPGLLSGIAFDTTGRFRHRLLVTVTSTKTTVEAIGCNGRVSVITRTAPRVEGGMAVAPASFGAFAGDLIAPDELSGRVFAITPRGRSLLVANSGLPHGGDIGVESEAFVPAGSSDALLADRLTPGSPHPGDDLILRIDARALKAAGARAGDLLVATEGGALTDAIRCMGPTCTVHYVAKGPKVAHGEGHIAFAATR